jgi:adenosylcobinamide kinase / adenosylcobinamide-phosphate guanylyltransferase
VFNTKLKNGCVLILGGAKSGKSTLALRLCNDLDLRHIFIATAESKDAEMEERIRRHRAERGEGWTTVEEPLEVSARINELDSGDTVILVDCLTLWLSNQFMKHGDKGDEIYRNIKELAVRLAVAKGVVAVVSNDVSMGIVPENRLAREFRDAAGYMNQRVGAIAKKVVVTFAGLPMMLKDE